MGDDHHHPSPRAPFEARVAALEALLVEKGILDTETIDAVVEHYEHDVGPMNGARVVARAWADEDFRERLLADGTPAIAELGFSGPEGDHMVVVENTPEVHNVIVCTLCSCYPWPVLGLPPNWYKSPPTARGWFGSPVRCSPKWGATSLTSVRSASGTRPQRFATSSYRCARRERRTCRRRSSRAW
ncbi:MAG TPA: nitrile hydratase subunit alpha [Acidimicrobiales bacterium]|jgi:hypothetical protein|nr:nitrile hydratase subunit alpha [Acidimicrobiales bacterium]